MPTTGKRVPGEHTGLGPGRPTRWRRPWASLLAIALALGAIGAACSRPTPLAGSDLGGIPAPDFTLADQDGQTVQLSALRGRPVVVSFLFTQCPDVCPLTAAKLRQVADKLGRDAERVALVAVSTDPANDDPAAAQAFSEQHGLAGRWHYLVGSQAELQPVWAAYHMYVATAQTDSPAEQAMARQAGRAVHTDALFVVDRQGRERSLLRSDFEPDALVATLKRLLSE
jgi:protein SCO1/2